MKNVSPEFSTELTPSKVSSMYRLTSPASIPSILSLNQQLEGCPRAGHGDTAETLNYASNVDGRRWRLVELARLGGITEQQVRNYLAADLLPPAPRAANNYRVFTDHHADALRTARALAAGHGWARARAVLAAVHRGDIPAA